MDDLAVNETNVCLICGIAALSSASDPICEDCWQRTQEDIQNTGASASDDVCVPLLRADPHRWGSGLVHKIDPDNDKTFCGKSPAICPGTKFQGYAYQITCKSCLRSTEARIRAHEYRAEFDRKMAEREQNNRLWWQRYNAYLLTPIWRAKRIRVMKRAAGICEGCGERSAIQVHHLRYPMEHPGSDEWISQEKLFDLVAVCAACHDDIHKRDR